MHANLRPEQLRAARRLAGLTQQQAAGRLRVSQAYLALIERGQRPVTAELRPRLVGLYELGPLALPLDAGKAEKWGSSSMAAGLAALGYPGFRHLAGARRHNPATLLLAALAADQVEVRVLEALPWVAVEYNNLDWEWLVSEVKVRDLQNRLGFVVTLARQVAEKRREVSVAVRLREVEEILCRARLVREDTLCQASLSQAERRWLRRTRPTEARYWKLLSDLRVQLLPYAS